MFLFSAYKIMNMKIYILLFLLTFAELFAKSNVVIYSDEGTWEDGIVALEHFLDWKGYSVSRVFADEINSNSGFLDADILIIPGGYAYDYSLKINHIGNVNIHNFVNNGGAYLGICAGAYYASDSIVWEGEQYPYPLNLFSGISIGSIHSIIPWDNYTMTSIGVNKNNSINEFQPNSYSTLYFGGPFFQSSTIDFDTIATWSDYYNLPAAINFGYGKGRVALIGPHFEIEENDTRDGTSFADDLIDNDSEWHLLWSIFDWLSDAKISNSPDFSSRDNLSLEPINSIQLVGNSFDNEIIFDAKMDFFNPINIAIYDRLGRNVYNNEIHIHYAINSLKVENLSESIYFIRFSLFGTILLSSIIMLN